MSASEGSKWRDLAPRVLSALVMAAIGIGAIVAGHGAFTALVLIVGGIGFWELWRMARVKQRADQLTSGDQKWLFAYAVLIVMGVAGLIHLSAEGGPRVLVYAILLVVITDSFGYIFGRLIGGPKFWPRISPKKTWAGIVAGWIGAGLLGYYGDRHLPGDFARLWFLVFSSMFLSFASQMGDFFESALKRRMGVKDSSNIIPGHGGVLDRFDALIALGAIYLILAFIFG